MCKVISRWALGVDRHVYVAIVGGWPKVKLCLSTNHSPFCAFLFFLSFLSFPSHFIFISLIPPSILHHSLILSHSLILLLPSLYVFSSGTRRRKHALRAEKETSSFHHPQIKFSQARTHPSTSSLNSSELNPVSTSARVIHYSLFIHSHPFSSSFRNTHSHTQTHTPSLSPPLSVTNLPSRSVSLRTSAH